MANEILVKSVHDYLNNEIINSRWHERATADPTDITTPNAAQVGRHWFRDDLLRVRYHDGTDVTHVPRIDTGKTETVSAHWTFDRGASTPPFSAAAALPSVGSTATRVTNFNAHYLNGYLHDAANIGDTIGLRLSDGRMKGEDPTDADDFATKQYVDNFAQGFRVADEVRVATTANLAATYSAGVLTATGNGSINSPGIDGVTTLIVGDRILVKNQSTGGHNGIYDITVEGDGSNPFELTRSSDADTAAEVTAGLAVFVNSGTANGFSAWAQTEVITTIGTDVQIWKLFNRSGSFSAGNGMVLVGSVFHFASSSNYTPGALFYASSTVAVGQSAALSGIVQGNGTSAPTAITGTAGRITKWAATAPYLVDSIISESGQALTLNGGASSISTSTGNLTLASGGGNGSILFLPNGTGLALLTKATTTPASAVADIGFAQLTTTVSTSNSTHKTSPSFVWGAQIWNGSASVAKSVLAQVIGVTSVNSGYYLNIASTDITMMTIRGDTGATSIPGAITTAALFTGTTALFTGNVTIGGVLTVTGVQVTGLTANRWVATDTATGDLVTPAGAANQLAGVTAAGTAREFKTLTQTANQVLITHGVGTITLSTPQDIHTGASPTFIGLTLSALLTGTTALFTGNVTTGGLVTGAGFRATGLANNRWIATDTATPDFITPTPSANAFAATNSSGTGIEYKTILGTVNQIDVSHAVGSITISMVGSPAITGLNLSGLNASRWVGTDASKNLVTPSSSANQLAAMDAAGTAREFKTISGASALQVIVTHGVGTISLSLPQNIATTSTPIFSGANFNGSGVVGLQSDTARLEILPDTTAAVTRFVMADTIGADRLHVLYVGTAASAEQGVSPGAVGLNALQSSFTISTNSVARITVNFDGTVTVAGVITNSALTASRLMVTSASKELSSNAALTSTRIPLANGTGSLTDSIIAQSTSGANHTLTLNGGGSTTTITTVATALNIIANGGGNLTLTTSGSGKVAQQYLFNTPIFADGSGFLVSTGTVGISQGGTGQSLTDPGGHRLLGWDDTDNAIKFFTIGTGLSYDAATDTLSSTAVGSGGTVTSIAATQPPAGFTIAGSPITTSGTLVFTLSDDLAAVEGISTTGIVRRTALNTWSTISLGSANRVLGVNSAGTDSEYKSILGTANQVTVTHGANSITLSLPQNIHTAATPTFAGITVSGSPANNITKPLAETSYGYLALQNAAGTRKLEIVYVGTGMAGFYGVTPGNVGVNASDGITFSTADTARLAISAAGVINLPALTASRFLKLDASKNLVVSSASTITLATETNGILTLAQGGTGSSLADPGFHALLAWDNTDNDVRFINIGSGLSYDAATDTLSSSGGGGGGTVTSVDVTPPAAGFDIAGGPITGAGTFVFTLDDDLEAVEALATTGIVQRTALDTWSTISIVPLSQGGTGSNLSDPGADRLLGWDNTNNDIRFFTIGSGLSYDAATDTLTASGAALVQGNGIVISGSTIHFASSSNYTAGAIFYASSTTAVGQSAALSGILQGNNTSAPTAITGTAGRLSQWAASAPYLTASIIGISGQDITINGGDSTITSSGLLTIAATGATGHITLTPGGAGAVILTYMAGGGGSDVVFAGSSGGLTTTGTVEAVQGGTGFASYTVGDILYANTTTTLAKLADVAVFQVLHSGGVGVAPFYAAVDLANDTTGIVSLAKGGTGFSLSAQSAHKLLGWDNTNADVRFFTIGTGLSYDASTDTLSATGSVGSGTIGRFSKWSSTTALTDSIVSESGQVLTLNGGASTIQTSSGDFTLTSAAGNGSILLTPNGTGIVRISRASSTFLSETAHLSIESTSTSPVKRVDIGYEEAGDFGWIDSYHSATGQMDFVIGSLNTRFVQNGTERWRITSTGILQAAGAQTVQTATGNLTLATAAGNGSILLTTHGTGLVQVSSLTASRFVKTDGSSNLSVSSASTIVLSSEVSGVLPLANGGTGSALVDPAAHMLMGWNNLANEVRFITMGSGLAFDPNFDVLTVTASGAPGGDDTEVQFNNAGAFGGSDGLTWNDGDYALQIGTTGTPGILRLGNESVLRITPPGGTAYSNLFVGSSAGSLSISTGSFNTGCGGTTLASLVDGSFNDAFGYVALANVVDGARNVAIGCGAGTAIVDGEYNVLLGHSAAVSGASAINQIVIGGRGTSAVGSSSVVGQGDNTCTIGGVGTAATYLNVNAGQASALRAWVGGTVFVDTDEVLNIGTSQETLMSFVMPAGTMAQAGDRVIIRASGYAVALGANVINAAFGSSTVFTTTGGDGQWFFVVEVVRIDSTNQRVHSYGGLGGSFFHRTDLIPITEDLDTPITIATGTVAANASNVHQLSMTIEWHPRST